MQPASLHSRVLTSVSWDPRPPSPWGMQAGFGAAVTAAQVLAAEGDSGLLFTQVEWSDGQTQYVEAQAGAGASSDLEVSAGTANVVVTAPGETSANQALPVANSEAYWRAEVAYGATYECTTSGARVAWRVCGRAMAAGDVPLFLNMPSPATLALAIGAARLTAPGDDAARPPLSLATAARLTTTVGHAKPHPHPITPALTLTVTLALTLALTLTLPPSRWATSRAAPSWTSPQTRAPCTRSTGPSARRSRTPTCS